MRRRIVGLAVLAATLATVVFGVPLAVAVGRYFVTDEQHELERVADVSALAVSGDLSRAARASVLPAHEPGVAVAVYAVSGKRVAGPGPLRAGTLVQRAFRGSVAAGELGDRFAVAAPVSDGDTVVGATLVTAGRGAVYGRIARAWLVMLALAAAAVGATWLLALRQTRRLVTPLDRLVVSAERLGDGDFTARTGATGVSEIDRVSTSLDRTAARLGDALERERAFSNDASHQLRTPLAGLQLGLETALATPGADLRAAAVDALHTASRLDATVTDLLALARHRPSSARPLDVAILLDQLRSRWHGLLAGTDRPLRVARGADLPPAHMSAAAATQILDVLLDNALRHGAGAVTVTARDADGPLAIDVADEGTVATLDSRQLFERPGAQVGSGIGLPLARRLAEAEGGRLVLSRQAPACFTLLAPSACG